MLLAAAAPRAQAPEVQDAMLRAFRGVEDPAGHGFADLDAVYDELERIEGRLDELPEARRAQARFFVAVRRCEVRLRQQRLGDAASIGSAAREDARAAGVWRGSYRALLLVLLEQCLAAATLDGVFEEERDYLDSAAPLADAPWLALPIELLRAELALRTGTDREGMRRLSAAADRAIHELPGSGPWRVKAVGRLAWELVVRGELDRADVYLKELPPEIARYPRGMVALRRGDFDLALRAGRALERAGRKVPGLQLQGEALEELGRAAEAREVYQRLVEEVREPVDRAVALRSLADTERALAAEAADPGPRLEEAERLYRDALEALGSGRHADAERVQILAALGETLEACGRLDEARNAYRGSLDRLDVARRELAVDLFGASFLDVRHLRAVEGLLRLRAPEREVARALVVTEVAKARTLLDWTREPPRAPFDVTRAVRDLVLSADPGAIDARLRELEDARREADSDRLAEASTLSLLAVVHLLESAPETAFVSYWLGERRLYAVVARGPDGAVLDLGDAESARSALVDSWASVVDPDADPDAALGRAASVFLPASLLGAIGDAHHVVVCPDDRLTRVPFEALPVEGEAFGLTRAVERAPSLSVWDALRNRCDADADGRVVVVSEVDASDVESRLELEPLAFSARERELVERAYGERVTALRGDDAKLASLRAAFEAGPVDLVHVSAHAVEDRRLPTASVLVLADGPVSIPSLCTVDLRGAFVVLSACSTGTGEARGGEGDLGLLGWPVAAGARGAVTSLWPVNQQATADLMGQFHAFCAEGFDEVEAMRRARRVLAEAPQYAHPHYWAGFGVLAPRWPDPPSTAWRWIAAVALVVACGAWITLRGRR